MEHLALDAGQGKDRQIDHHDDQLPEKQRSTRLTGCLENLVEALRPVQGAAQGCPSMG